MRVRFVLAALVSILSISTAFAAPNLINYQGTLTDGTGQSINGATPIVFKLFNAEVGGAELWTESQTVQAQNGIYHTLLGSLVALPESLFKSDQVWIEITVSSEVLVPRQQLVSVPYARRAAMSDCIPGDTLVCYTGAPATRGVGVCQTGYRICDVDGKGFGECAGEILPLAEACDELDNNCNGMVDEGCPLVCPMGTADCDVDGITCETTIASDNNNCGVCGNTCTSTVTTSCSLGILTTFVPEGCVNGNCMETPQTTTCPTQPSSCSGLDFVSYTPTCNSTSACGFLGTPTTTRCNASTGCTATCDDVLGCGEVCQ